MTRKCRKLLQAICRVTLLASMLCLSIAGANAQTDQQAVLKVLDRYMDAVNRIDIEGITGTYHFPHFRVAKGDVVVWSTPEEAMPMLGLPREQQLSAMRAALGKDWQRTEWAYRTVIAAGATKAHVDTEFIRYNGSGEELERVNSLYILTKKHDAWGIKGRSSFSSR